MKGMARLLLLVALLMPIRGAVALAGTLCPSAMAGTSSMATEVHEAQPHAHGVDGHGIVEEGAGHHGRTHLANPDTEPAACNLCTAACGAPYVPSASPAGVAVISARTERMAGDTVHWTTVALPGPERPPRTI